MGRFTGMFFPSGHEALFPAPEAAVLREGLPAPAAARRSGRGARPGPGGAGGAGRTRRCPFRLPPRGPPDEPGPLLPAGLQGRVALGQDLEAPLEEAHVPLPQEVQPLRLPRARRRRRHLHLAAAARARRARMASRRRRPGAGKWKGKGRLSSLRPGERGRGFRGRQTGF